MTLSFQTRLFTIASLLALAIGACAPPTLQESCSPVMSRVTIPQTEVRAMQSATTGHNYDIYIRLPEEYALYPTARYPVLYVLDGQWDFKLLDSIYGGLLYDGAVPDMIIVGVTYSGVNPDYSSLRAMDYTPVRVSISDSGGAPQFHTFVKEELMPFIETNYQADPAQRVLMGNSFGGSFTLYALFTEPALFWGYVAASPAVPFGDNAAFKQEAEYARTHSDLPARLFLSVGELDPLAEPVEAYMQIIKERNYTGLTLETRTLASEGHGSNKPEAFNRGLRFIFQDD